MKKKPTFRGRRFGSLRNRIVRAAHWLRLQREGADPVPVYTWDAPDNLINHGVNFANWAIEGASSADANGMYCQNNGTLDYLRYDLVGLSPSTDYWLKLVCPAKGSQAGNLRLHITPTDGAGLDLINGAAANYDFPTPVPFTKYVKIRTDSTGGPYKLAFRNANSADSTVNSRITVSECAVYANPTRSSAKICVLGDRESGLNTVPGTAAAVDTAILASTFGSGDAVNVVSPGDLFDGTPTLATNNDNVKNTLIGRGGDLYAAVGNWDYVGGIAAWVSYFGRSADYDTYFQKSLGLVDFFTYDTNGHVDNDQTSAAAAKASGMGQWLINALASSTAKWKIVIFHHPAKTSSSHSPGGYPAMAWNWKDYGAHAVFQSHDHVYERLRDSNGAYYFTVGMGGAVAHAFGSAVSESQARVTTPGFLKISDSDTDLVFEYFDTAGNMLDRARITRS